MTYHYFHFTNIHFSYRMDSIDVYLAKKRKRQEDMENGTKSAQVLFTKLCHETVCEVKCKILEFMLSN